MIVRSLLVVVWCALLLFIVFGVVVALVFVVWLLVVW